MSRRRRVILVQLPIPPLGPGACGGNTPLAAGYLTMFARAIGLTDRVDLQILPPTDANLLSDRAIASAILDRDPWMVGFTCYLWNIDRTLWIARLLKDRRPDLRIVVGGPEVTGDNQWVLDDPGIDFACVGEGEQTFADLLMQLVEGSEPATSIPGLHVRGRSLLPPTFRSPLARLDVVSSPYLDAIIDLADDKIMLLETVRGCVFKCKFCYYPKAYDSLYFVSRERIVANLEYARRRGAREVVLLDPTLNQRRDFLEFLQLLADQNPDHQFSYFGELRGEGITPAAAQLMRKANFTEVEIGLQSVDRQAQDLMDRTNNLKAFERGARAMIDAGIRVKVDLIIGLPGDTVDSIRRGIEYLHKCHLYDDVQVFNLAILPGTAFRSEATALGLRYQPRPPYYVLRTPTLGLDDLYRLMAEAQDVLEAEYDVFPPPVLRFPVDATWGPLESALGGIARCWVIDLDSPQRPVPPPDRRSLAFTVWFRGSDLSKHRARMAEAIRQVLADNPHTSLQIVLEPTSGLAGVSIPLFEELTAVGQENPSYLDRFYSLQPGKAASAKRIVEVFPAAERDRLDPGELQLHGEWASIVWTGRGINPETLEEFEYLEESRDDRDVNGERIEAGIERATPRR